MTLRQAEPASSSTQPTHSSSFSEVPDLKVWCLTESTDHSRCSTGKDRKSHFCPWNSSYSPLSTDRPALHQTALDSDLRTPLMPPQWLRMKTQGCKHKNTTHVDTVVTKERWTHWNQQDCDMLGSGGPGSSDKEWGKGQCPCICTDPDWGCKAEEQAQGHQDTADSHWDWWLMRPWVHPLTLSNISKSLALGWWIVQMIVRPPWARDFIRETTWKQDALSRPLPNQTKRYVSESLLGSHKCTFNDVSPGGLIKEHDGGIIDQLKGDGKSFALTPGQTAGACLSTFLETQSSEDLIHLSHEQVETYWQISFQGAMPLTDLCFATRT